MFSTLRLLTLRLKTVKWRFYGWTEKKTQQTEFGFCRLYSFAGWKCFFRLSEKKRKKHSWQIERRKNTFRLCLSEVLKAKKMTFFHLFFWQLLRYDSYKKRNLDFSTCRLENNWKTVIKQTFIDTEFKKLFVNLRRFCAVWQLAGILIFISTFLAVWLCVYPLRQLTITRQVTKRNKLLRKLTKFQRWADERQTKFNKLLHITHAYVHWLAESHLAVFAPAFPLSFHDRKFARRPPVLIASVVTCHSKKK